MRYEQIKEGVEYGDLQSLVKNIVSIAEFEPKTGIDNDVVVIGFYVDDESPAQDLGTFLERGVAEILDTEVSPNPDDEGYYMVFVEIDNDENGLVDVVEGFDEIDLLLKKHQKKIISIDSKHVMEFVQVSNYLKLKKKSVIYVSFFFLLFSFANFLL